MTTPVLDDLAWILESEAPDDDLCMAEGGACSRTALWDWRATCGCIHPVCQGHRDTYNRDLENLLSKYPGTFLWKCNYCQGSLWKWWWEPHKRRG